jgi:hypothetical protein
MKRSTGLKIVTFLVVLSIAVAGTLVTASAVSGSEPPVPQPCSWCIYDVEWWEGEQEPSGDPDETNYYAAHTVEWLDAGHTEILPMEPPLPIVIPDPTFHQYVDFYGGPGHPAGEWVPCEPERHSFILGDIRSVSLEFFNSRHSLINWKTLYGVETPLGPVQLQEWEESIVPISGDPGWPWVVGEVWETNTRFCALPPDVRRHAVEATETIVTDLFPGGIECYRVCTDRECRWYHDDYGCPIRWEVYPWDVYTGWEYRDLIWYGPDPPFPPWQPPPTPTPVAGVGGIALPTDKLGLMMPWILGGAALVLGGLAILMWRTRINARRLG